MLGSDRNFGSVRDLAGFGRFDSIRFGKNSWYGRFKEGTQRVNAYVPNGLVL